MKTSLKATLIASAIAALPLGVDAAGLGPINVYSGLGQPLRAEIEIKATPQELESLTARIAPPEAFRQANVPYSAAVTGLRLAVETRGTRPVVRISSDRPLDEPFVDLLVELNWTAGRLVREYTFLLDPVDVSAPAQIAAQAATPARAPRAADAAPAPARASARSGDQYQVARGDTLRRVAEMHRPAGATLDQMLVALYRENVSAFEGGNMNRLRAGAILRIPDEPVAQAVDAAQARREILAQASDFEAYRSRLAGTVAGRPAAVDDRASQMAAGSIVPRVAEPARPRDSGDRVKVSGGSSDQPPATADAARLARLQALEEELVARDKALEEANSRVAELEKSIREFQQLIELRNKSLAQMQGQAAGAAAAAQQPAPSAEVAPDAGAPAAAEQSPVTETPAAAATPPVAETAPATEAPAAQAAAPAPAPAPVEPVQEPSFLQTLLDDPTLVAGGGAALVLLLGLAGYKVRQRRKEEEAIAKDIPVYATEAPQTAGSVFGQSGGQSVDTGNSVLQTDFSQSGLSAIDADEGVDPVAEADVYMAYGRDAQAEEILLDALKVDASRPAIYLKLLEIYAQRKSLKQFEAIATDLYSRTGGEGSDWVKAAELGRVLDADNPLYTAGSSGGGRGVTSTLPGGRMAAGAAAAAVASSRVEPPAEEFSTASLADLDFTSSVPSGSSPAVEAPVVPDELAMPDGFGEIALDESALADDAGISLADSADQDVAAASGIDSGVLDFDLDLDVSPATAAPSAPAAVSVPAADEAAPLAAAAMDDLVFDLDIDGGAIASEPAEAVDSAPDFVETQAVRSLDANELQLPDAVRSVSFDLDLDGEGDAEEKDAKVGDSVMDLEKTTFDDSLLDFDLDLDTTAVGAAPKAAALDLSGIDLDLELPDMAAEEEVEVEPAIEVLELGGVGGEPVTESPMNSEVAQEIDTKLELARAYEEMGDKEGARELVEEVLRDGSTEQRTLAARLMERLA